MSKNIILATFEHQVERLIERTVWNIAGMNREDFFGCYIDPLKQQLDWVSYSENALPLVIVLPKSFIPLPALFTKANGAFIVDLALLRNIDMSGHFPVPYLATDAMIRPLQELRICDPIDLFTKERRFGLTVDEGLSLMLYYPHLLLGTIDLPGSVYGDDYMPYLYSEGGQVALYYGDKDEESNGRRTSSCRNRIWPRMKRNPNDFSPMPRSSIEKSKLRAI